MKTTKNKSRNRRVARKRAARLKKYGCQDEPAMCDTMRACRRGWGMGIGR